MVVGTIDDVRRRSADRAIESKLFATDAVGEASFLQQKAQLALCFIDRVASLARTLP